METNRHFAGIGLETGVSGLPVVPRALGKQAGLGTSTFEQLPKPRLGIEHLEGVVW
jgi:hypothetical protein